MAETPCGTTALRGNIGRHYPQLSRSAFLCGEQVQAVGLAATFTKVITVQQMMFGDYLRGLASRRFAGTPLGCLVTGSGVSAASNNCRNPCSNSSTAFPKAPSCPTRTIATDRCRSNDGGRNTFTESMERFLAIKRAGSSPTP